MGMKDAMGYQLEVIIVGSARRASEPSRDQIEGDDILPLSRITAPACSVKGPGSERADEWERIAVSSWRGRGEEDVMLMQDRRANAGHGQNSPSQTEDGNPFIVNLRLCRLGGAFRTSTTP
nr:hypothetical protein CFP56_09846 [Quercus suber]